MEKFKSVNTDNVQITKLTLTVIEAAKLIGVSTGTIYSMARQGEIPCVKVRGRVLFHRDTIERWLRGELVGEGA